MSRPDIPVTISGDDRGFRAAMARVRAAAGTTGGNVTAAFMRVKMAAGAIPAAFAAAGFTALIAASRDAASSVASIGDEAKRAGLGVKAFQELKFVAEQNRIGVDQLTDGIKELNLRADEFISTGGGAAAEAFQRLGFSATELKDKLKDPAALFSEIIGRLGQLDKAAQIRISDEVFGGSAGERFVELIDQGERGIRSQIKAANDLGIVMDEELIEKAAEVDRQFNIVATTVGTALKGAIVSATASLMEFMDGFRSFEQQRDRTLQNRQTAIMGEKQGVASEIRATQADIDALGGSGATGMLKESIVLLERRLDELNREEDQIISVLSNRFSPSADSGRRTNVVLNDDDTNKGNDNNNRGGGGRTRTTAATAADKEAEAIKRVVQALNDEIAAVGLSAVEREKLQALREAGVSAASKEGQQISALVEQKHRQIAAEEALLDAREQAQQAAEDFGATLDDQLDRIIDGTFKARDALSALVKELARAMTGGQGLFSGLFSKLFDGGGLTSSSFVPNTTLSAVLGFGGGRAGGGPVSPGRLYEVNEKEQEFFVPKTHGNIVAPGRMGGEAVNVTYAPVMNFSGTSQEMAEFRRQAEADRQSFATRSVMAIREAKKRNTPGL